MESGGDGVAQAILLEESPPATPLLSSCPRERRLVSRSPVLAWEPVRQAGAFAWWPT